LDLLPNEDHMRWRPHTRSQLRVPRIPVAAQRACYLCPCIDGADGVYWPETLEHVLLKCTCPQLVALRVAVRSELRDIAADPDAVELARDAGVDVPQFDDDTQLYTVLRLCVGVGPVSALQAVPVALLRQRCAELVRSLLTARPRLVVQRRGWLRLPMTGWTFIVMRIGAVCLPPRAAVWQCVLPGMPCGCSARVVRRWSLLMVSRRARVIHPILCL